MGAKDSATREMTPTPAIEPRIELGILILASFPSTFPNIPNSEIPPRDHPLVSTTSQRTTMFSRATLRSSLVAQRGYATLTTPNTLILLEHKADAIVPATLNAITAAKQLGGNLTALIVGEEAETKAVVDKAKK